jgi:hypothetical protein
MVWTGKNTTTYVVSPDGDWAYNNVTVSEATTPITNVTAPGEPTPIPSGWPLNWTNANVTLTFNRTDTGTGVNWTNYSKTAATGPWTTVNATTATGTDAGNVSGVTAASFNVTVSDEGSTTIWYYSVDKNVTANEETPHKNLMVRIDKTEPGVISANATPDVLVVNITDTVLSVTNATDLSGVANVTVNLFAIGWSATQELEYNATAGAWQYTTNASIAAGLVNLPVNATDAAGNSNTSMNIMLTVNPVIHDVNVTTSYYPQGNGIKILHAGNPILPEQNLTINETYNIGYQIRNDGNVDEPKSLVNISVMVCNATGWNESIREHNTSLNVSQSKPFTAASWNTTGCTAGNYTIWVNASVPGDADLSNNNRSRESNLSVLAYRVELTVDGAKTANKTTTDGIDAIYNLTVTNTGTEQDNFTLHVVNPDGATTAVISDDNNGTWTSPDTYKTKDINSSENVIVHLKVAGASASVKTFRVNVTANSTADSNQTDFINTTTTVKTDLDLPQIAINSPINRSIHNTKTITLSASADEPIDTWMYSLNGAANVTFATGGTTASTTINETDGVVEGLNNVTVYANDTSENMGNSSLVYFTVDTKKPTVTIINSPTAGYYNTNITVNATVTDPDPTNSSGIKQVMFRWKNLTDEGIREPMNRIPGTDFWNATFDTTGMKADNYTIIVNATDNASNANFSNVTNVAIDRTDPTFEIAFTTNFTTHITNLSINVSELLQTGAPVVNVTNGTTVNLTDLGGIHPLWNWSYPIITTGTSNYTITVNGTDLAGNYHESVAYSNVTYVTIPKDTPMEISAPPNTSISMTLNTKVDNASIAVTKTDENPTDVARADAVAFVNIDVNATQIKEAYITSVTIRVYYNKSNLPVGTTEDQLAIYWLNETVWERLSSTVNKTGQYVEATVDHLSTFAAAADTTPPASITSLSHTVGQTWIKWTWTNPTDVDFNYTMIYLDGSWKTNTSEESYTAEGLTSDTSYEIGTKTVDTAGNINQTPITDTAKTTAAPAAPRGGGARVVAPPINVPVDPTTGEITSTTSLTVEKATLTIPAGIIVKDVAGSPLATSITTMHTPTTAKTVGAIAAYDFGPSGTTFSKPIDLVIEYDPAEIIPAGFSESDLVIKMYDGTAKAWIDLDTSVDTAAHTATARVSHFTIFALFATAPVAPPPVITPTPIPTVPPAVTPTATPIPPVVPPAKLPWGLIIGIIIALIVVGAAAYYFYTKKKT